jgi:hypothetical protein
MSSFLLSKLRPGYHSGHAWRLFLSFFLFFHLLFQGAKTLTDDGTITPHLYSGVVRRTTTHDTGLATVRA